jgi:hypothetical protein
MEDVRPGVLHHGLCGQGVADVAASDGLPGCLDSRAEHRVRGNADEYAGSVGLFEEGATAVSVDTDRLLRPDVLAGRDRLR